jgi:hypothetical protein
MSEVISIQFPDISGDVSGYTAFIRNEAGALLNGVGDAITETGATGLWTFTLAETRAANTDYHVRIYAGAAEVPAELVYDGILYAGQTLVDKQFPAANKTLIHGTVGPTAPGTTSFTPSSLTTGGSSTNQWIGRNIVFHNDTTTSGLRGQATDITAVSAAALPLLTFTALSTAPVSGDTFSVI